MIKVFIILLSLGLIFYIVTYSYSFKVLKKVQKVLQFKEITFIENKDFDYDEVVKDLEKDLFVERRVTTSKEYINEELEYVVIRNKGEVSDSLPCLILLHGLRDCPDDWLERGRIRENYLILLKSGKIQKMNIVLINSGCDGMGWYTNFYRDKLFSISLFDDLPDQVKNEIVKTLDIRLYEINEKTVVLKQGNLCCNLYVLLEGKLEVNIIDANGNEVLIEYIEAPRAFATPHLFKKDNRLPATFRTLEKSVLLTATKDSTFDLISRHYID